jgi:hypothetical protein
MQATVMIAILIGALVVILVRQRIRRKAAVIVAPRFATLNLKGAEAEALVQADTLALQPVFGVAEQSTSVAPKCDVLFLYSDLSADGRIKSTQMWLGELVRACEATILVVATENPGAAYNASKGPGYRRVNLVMTLSRRGDLFARFFVRLFEDMKRGTPMPLAWVKLAPQGPVPAHNELPGTMFACMAGQVTFRAA